MAHESIFELRGKNVAGREIASLQEHMDERLDKIENLINLSLISSVINQIEETNYMEDKNEPEMKELSELLSSYDVRLDKRERFGDKTAVYIRSSESMNISKVRLLLDAVLNMDLQIIPIFIFEKLNGMQRKKLLEERISFCVEDKELYITG